MRLLQFPDIEFRKLNSLVHDYCMNHSNTAELFEVSPNISVLDEVVSSRNFSQQNYSILSEVLLKQYAALPSIDAVNRNLQAFESGNAVTVATGHQLCLLGGPAYFFYKILSTIKLARLVSAQLNDRTVVPVFWLASEDHDKEEINHTYCNETRLEWNTSQNGAVGRFSLDGFEEVVNRWLDAIEDEVFRAAMHASWNRAMQFESLADLTRSWVHECFGAWGLVVINPDDARLKKLFVPILKRELLEGITYDRVAKTNERLNALGYHAQVNPRELNLFYLSPQSRVRIERNGNSWYTVDQRFTWSEEELLIELNHHPENFSPNVLLRPLYQETVLPNVAYVGGPGELAYWLQLRSLFKECEVPMPALILRDSAIVLSQTICKRLAKLGIDSAHLLKEKTEIVALLAGAKPDFSTEKEELIQLYDELAQRISKVDSTLKAAVLAEARRTITGVDQLEAKTWKAIKAREEQKLTALDKVWEEVFPANNWQERSRNILVEALSNNKQLLHVLLEEFQPPMGTLVIAEL